MFQKTKLFVAMIMLGSAVVGCSVAGGQQGPGAYVDDSTLTTRVKAKLVGDPAVSAGRINVETLNGTVQLSGFAKDSAERSRAEELAKTTSGVKSVRNDIRVQ